MTMDFNPAQRRQVAASLREAARIVAECEGWLLGRDGACDAIYNATYDRYGDALLDMTTEAFYDIREDSDAPPLYWWLYWWPRDEEHQSVRVLALLFAAEFVETEL